MRLAFQKDHLSISKFDSIDLPDFTVLTGVNGSGKSHLLAAIENKNVAIEDIEQPKIVHFNYETFRLSNETQTNAQQRIAERNSAWQLLSQPQNANIIGNLTDFKNALGEDYIQLTKISEQKQKPLWELDKNDCGGAQLFGKLTAYKTQVSTFFSTNPHLKDNVMASAIFVLAKKLNHSIDELSETDFEQFYEPYTLQKDFLPTQLGKIFMDYFFRYEQNQYDEYRDKEYGEMHNTLTKEQFESKYGPKPWDIVNEILETFNSLPYRINTPEGLNRDTNYIVKLVHQDQAGVSPQFSELSSGERILMALVASIFKASSDHHFPDILLLDEIDASLHPSMMQNLLDVIQSVFLKNGVKIILVTHSPTTIALAPEEAIYLMNASGEKRIEKKTKSDALSILTEGFATLDQGIKLFDQVAQAKVAVFTEGRNTVYVKKALELWNIEGVTVIEGVESFSGKNQLKTIFDFFSVLPHNSKVLFIWDCDVTYTLDETNNTFPFIFEKNLTNIIAQKGIENLFPENLFADFETSVKEPGKETRRTFSSNQKLAFESFILEKNDKSDFALFKPLIDEIQRILEM